jgi:hypothetical protein
MKIGFFALIVAAGALFFFPSCSARIEGALSPEGSAEFSLEASLEPRMSALIRSLSRLGSPAGAEASPGAILDGPAIARSMSAAPGLSGVSLRNTGPASVAGTAALSRVDAFLAIPGAQGSPRVVQYDPSGRLVITLDKSSGPRMLSLFSPEFTEYLSALMAPVATGIDLPETEYLDLVASVYGRPLAEEIAASRIAALITFPRPISSVRGGSASGAQARFEIPLLKLLVLESPLIYEVVW